MKTCLEAQINDQIRQFHQRSPKFPNGTIDYYEAKEGMFIQCYVCFNDLILLLRRPAGILRYQNKWNVIAGFIDTLSPIQNKIYYEVKHQAGIKSSEVESYQLAPVIKMEYNDINDDKVWFVVPALVSLKSNPDINLNWEHSDFKWINPNKIQDFDTVEHVDKNWKYLISNI